MKALMFPGQGSQAKGMGESLFDEFADLVDKASSILGYSIKELCIDDPRKELGKTQFTQPALYVVNALSYFKYELQSDQKADYLIGHSLGEFNALMAAGCFDFETGLGIVKKRGELMSTASGGGMAAILNASREDIEKILAENNLATIDLANFNTPSQIVISGPKEDIGKAQEFFTKDKMLYFPLNTSGAFHSRYMKESAEEFETYLNSITFSAPNIPVISNVSATPYGNNGISKNLSEQMFSGVRWSDSIKYLRSLSYNNRVDEPKEMEFIEIGYNDVLTKMLHKIKREIPVPERVLNTSNTKPVFRQEIKTTFEPEAKTSSQASTEVEQKVQSWNQKYPVGTKVTCLVTKEEELETRTEAVVLFGHRAAVYMRGYNGYFNIEELRPVMG